MCLFLLIALCLPQPAAGWGPEGHFWVNRAAAEKIPSSMPRFLRQRAAREKLTWLGYEPDRWRSRAEPHLRAAQAPDHFIDLELVAHMDEFPPDRYAFYRALYERRAEMSGEEREKLVPETVGLQPYIALEVYERLRVAFREYRQLKAERKPTATAEHTAIFYAGWLGHYVADAAQPLHTTIHYDGWVGENPQGFRGERGIHWQFEGEFVAANLRLQEFAGLVKAPVHLDDPRAAYVRYLRDSHALVEKFYQMEKTGAFQGAGTPGGREFTRQRLAAGSQMLLNLWYTAWVESAEPAPPRTAPAAPAAATPAGLQ